MSQEKICVTRKIHSDALDILQAACAKNSWSLQVWPHEKPPTPHELSIFTRDCSALLSMVTDTIDQTLINSLPRLRVIANHAVGMDNIDMQCAREKKIALGNTPDVLTHATAELAVALTMALLRNLPKAVRKVKAQLWNTWGPLDDLGLQIGGHKNPDDGPLFGIYGLGRIGKKIGHILSQGFGARVAYTNTQGPLNDLAFKAKWLSPVELVATSHVLIVALPATDKTKGIFNLKLLSTMPVGAYFINIARGNLHSEEALMTLLQTRHLAGVALDVTNPEPASWGQNPLLNDDRVIITPHMGSATFTARRDMGMVSAQNIINFLESKTMPYPLFLP